MVSHATVSSGKFTPPLGLALLSRAQAGQNKNEKPRDLSTGLFVFNAWQCPTFTWGDPTLSSALCVFTSEFGMGSGGARTLWPPGKLAAWMKNHPDELGSDKDGATELPAYQSSWVLYDQASRAISTG